MTHFFLLYLSALGIGNLLRFKKDNSNYIQHFPSFYFYLGFLAIPVLLYLLNSMCTIPLDKSSWVVFIIGLVGICTIAFQKSSRQFWMTIFKGNPLTIFPVYIIVMALIYSPYAYKIGRWDEFTHWLLMPKQIFYANSVIHFQMPFTDFIKYTPGWPLLVNYSQKILNIHFEEGPVIYCVLLGGIGVLSFTFEIFLYFLQKNKIKNIFLWSWLLILTLVITGIPSPLFERSVLIENSLQNTLFFCLIFLIKPIDSNCKNTIYLSIIFIAGILFKSPFFIYIPGIILGGFFYLKNYSVKSKIWWAVIPFMSSFIIYMHWKFQTSSYPHYWAHIGASTIDLTSIFLSHKSFEIYFLFIKKMAVFILLNPLSYIAIYSMFFYRKSPLFHGSSVSCLLIFTTFTLGLIWIYLAVMGEIEASYLASFDRYFGMMFRPLQAFGCFVFFVLISQKFNVSKYWLIIMIIGTSTFLIFQSRKNNFRYLFLYTPAPFISDNLPAIDFIVTKHNLDNPQILILDQTSQGQHRVAFNYFSIYGRLKPWFHVHPAFSFDIMSHQNNNYVTKTTPEEMDKLLRKSKIILPLSPTSWSKNFLAKYLSNQKCIDDLKTYIIYNELDNGIQLTCYEKGPFARP